MMYHEKLAIAVKSNGKVLREFGDTVRLPFGSEYSLFIKNLNSVRALVKIEIDGKDIADGESFIVQANSSIDIERFLKGGNKSAGNRFKFIERTSRVEDARGGIQVEDGLIRVEFEFEQESVPVKDYYHVPTPIYDYYHYPWYRPYRPYRDYPYWGSGQISYGSSGTVSSAGGTPVASINTVLSNASIGASAEGAAPQNAAFVSHTLSDGGEAKLRSHSINYSAEVKNDAGITAPGSVSHQQFTTAYIGALDGVKRSMVIKLAGGVGEVKVSKPVTVKSKQRCVTCGHQNKATAKFCSECGTGLEIVA